MNRTLIIIAILCLATVYIFPIRTLRESYVFYDPRGHSRSNAPVPLQIAYTPYFFAEHWFERLVPSLKPKLDPSNNPLR